MDNKVTKVSPGKKPILFKKACAYVRVSTEHKEQLASLENQTEYYKKLILCNPSYLFSGIYSDSGISGVKENRPGFQLMLEACRKGEIDIILTKSISRFSRNTVLLLKSIRELKSLGVAVIFEEQSINTLTTQGELVLTMLATIAEEERKSVSENIKWTFRNKFKQGMVMVDTNRLLGYDKDKSGNLVINKEESKIVKYIFEQYLSGISGYQIAKELNKINTYKNKPWSSERILSIISNEKYMGDALMQKSFINEQGKQVKNIGQHSKYYIKNNHQPIISKKKWYEAQKIRESRKNKVYPFSGRLHCSLCGATLIRTKSKWGVNWVCDTYINQTKSVCTGIRIPEETLEKISTDKEKYGHWVVKEVGNESSKNKYEKDFCLEEYSFG